jgi:hypothetical protein
MHDTAAGGTEVGVLSAALGSVWQMLQIAALSHSQASTGQSWWDQRWQGLAATAASNTRNLLGAGFQLAAAGWAGFVLRCVLDLQARPHAYALLLSSEQHL